MDEEYMPPLGPDPDLAEGPDWMLVAISALVGSAGAMAFGLWWGTRNR